MLQKLTIRNYALIEEIEIDFREGLSIITGETGAGKSIILGALGLLLGERNESKSIADKTKKVVVEALFKLPGSGEERIIRREISPSGKSRAFIDDTPATLLQLGEATGALLDIHSQHANLNLTGRSGQLAIIDAAAESHESLEDYRQTFREYVGVRAKLRRIKESNEKNREKRELMEYQLGELKKLAPKKGELEQVEKRFEFLSDADEIKSRLADTFNLLNGGDNSALNQIREASGILNSMGTGNPDDTLGEDEKLIPRLQNLYVELKDIAETIEGIADSIESSPALLAATGTRMRELLDAVKVFRVDDGDALVALKEELTDSLRQLDGADTETHELEEKSRILARQLMEKADKLTELRREGAKVFSRMLTERTIPLGLPNLRFEVGITQGKLTSEGRDTIEFLCCFNKNGNMLPMSATASGGELSRLTLGIKSMMAEKMEMPTIIFDEIDTGVSGEIADKMGKMMAEMSQKMQVITITHLPQVASRGTNHYKVFKRDTAERTVSDIRHLNPEERVMEIAAMLSGEKVTESSIKAAEDLIRQSSGLPM